MKTPFGLLALLAWMSHVAAAQQAVPPPQTPAPARPAEQLPSVAQFEARTDIVLVDVTVVSSNGDPLTGLIAAVSVGMYNGVPVLDLDYPEDSACETDMNVVMTQQGGFVEVQGTAEGHAFRRHELDALLNLAASGIARLFQLQTEVRTAA